MMSHRACIQTLTLLALTLPGFPAGKKQPKHEEITAAVLWRDPVDIASRNLFYGPGGKQHEPHGAFTFTEEDLDGTSPKIVVRGEDGVKWKVKLGPEARPETAASRLVWAAGFFANEDYFVKDVEIRGMPAHLRRGQKFVGNDGQLHDVRLKRHAPGEKKLGNWPWRENPFAGTREENGLRVLMALINNWDLTDENNAIYVTREGGAPIYMVSDVGSTFGTGTLTWPMGRARGNLDCYAHSAFITASTPAYVDFHTPARPGFFFFFTPREYYHKLQLRWIGQHIPREDARWIGGVLARLSEDQIRDAFRAAGYPEREMNGFADVVKKRIRELANL